MKMQVKCDSTLFGSWLFLVMPLGFAIALSANSVLANQTVVHKTKVLAIEIAQKSFPEIKTKKIKVETFKSKTSFFKAQFSMLRYLTLQRMRHLLFVNPLVFEKEAPPEGIRSIIAHELAHISYYTRKNRIELLGLSRLSSNGFTAKFERKADLEAIDRGYGKGLIVYREWLYNNIDQKEIFGKKRNYFTPRELKVILEVLKKKPAMIDVWKKNVPLNLEEIEKSV